MAFRDFRFGRDAALREQVWDLRRKNEKLEAALKSARRENAELRERLMPRPEPDSAPQHFFDEVEI